MTANHSSQRRRGVLIVPGTSEKMIGKALASGADEVVIDLEDAVTPSRKPGARDTVTRVLASTLPREDMSIAVRVNALSTEWAEDDLRALARCGDTLNSIVIPKVESPEQLERADALTPTHPATLQALIETPRGVADIRTICTANRLAAVIIGYADLAAALGRAPNLPPERWLAVQDRVLIAARCAGVAAIDGPHLGIADDDAFRHSARWARELGFDGKWVIHPSQVPSVTAEFTPSDAAVDDARRVLAVLAEAEAAGVGAAALDGKMLDEAVAVAARRTLDRVGATA